MLNTSTAIVHKKTSLLYSINELSNSAEANRLQYRVRLENENMNNVTELTSLLYYLPTRNRDAYNRYVRLAKLLTKRLGLTVAAQRPIAG